MRISPVTGFLGVSYGVNKHHSLGWEHGKIHGWEGCWRREFGGHWVLPPLYCLHQTPTLTASKVELTLFLIQTLCTLECCLVTGFARSGCIWIAGYTLQQTIHHSLAFLQHCADSDEKKNNKVQRYVGKIKMVNICQMRRNSGVSVKN